MSNDPLPSSGQAPESVDQETRLAAPADVLETELDDGVVLLRLDTGAYFRLDRVGMEMWRALSRTGSIQDAHERMSGEYDVEASLLQRDLWRLAEELLEKGLLAQGCETQGR